MICVAATAMRQARIRPQAKYTIDPYPRQLHSQAEIAGELTVDEHAAAPANRSA